MSHTDYGERFETNVSAPDYTKDEHDTLDYVFNWKPQLAGDTIFTSAFFLPDGLVKVSETNTQDTATIFVLGGIKGLIYRILNRITTVGGRTFDRTIRVLIKEH